VYDVPAQVGTGTMLGGKPIQLALANAAEDAMAFLIVGVAAAYAPFSGGIVVPNPSPPGAIIPTLTGPDGDSTINATWPMGTPPGFTTYYQWWIIDPAGPSGYSASNALSATTP